MNRKIITSVAILFVCLCVWTIGAENAAAPAPTGGFTKLALVDINNIFKKHAGFNEEMDQMKKEADELDKDMKEQAKSLKQQEELLKAMSPGSKDYTEAEEKITMEKAQFAIKVQTQRREFLMREAKCYYTTYQGIEGNIGEYARNHGIDLVLRFMSDPIDPKNPDSILAGLNKPVVWYNPKLDMTPEILRTVSEKQTSEEEKLAEKEKKTE